MSQTRIAVVVGSLRKESLNRQLALALAALAPQDVSFEHVQIDDLPLYNQDNDGHPPEPGVLFLTAEYNRSIPGVLKNAIDHASRPYGQSAWAGKPAGVIGISVGAAGTAMAQQHLRNILAYLDMPTLNQPEVYLQNKQGLFDDKGHIGNEDSRKFLQGWVDKYLAFVKSHQG